MSSLFPNDPLEVVFDNRDYTASDPNRQAITGEDVRRVNWTIEEMVNWLKYDPLVADPVFLRGWADHYGSGELRWHQGCDEAND